MSNQVSSRGVWAIALGFDFFADEAGAVGDEAVDHVDVGAVEDAFEVVGEGDVLGHEEVGVDAGGGGVGGEGTGGVAGGGDGEVFEAVVGGHGDGHAEAAGLEGAGGVVAFFLDEEAGVAAGADHGGPAFAEGDGGDGTDGGGGEDVAVAPHAEGGGLAAAYGRGCRGGRCGGARPCRSGRRGRRRRGRGSGGCRRRGGCLGVAGGFEVGDRGHAVRCARWQEGRCPGGAYAANLMGAEPAAGGDVSEDAGGEQGDGGEEDAGDPGQFEVAAGEEAVEDEDEDQDGGFGEEGGRAVGGVARRSGRKGSRRWLPGGTGGRAASVGTTRRGPMSVVGSVEVGLGVAATGPCWGEVWTELRGDGPTWEVVAEVGERCVCAA